MKKILLIAGLFTLAIASCIKKDATTSTTISVSYPTITFVNGQYFSVNVNAPYPTVTIAATDSFYNPCDTEIIDSAIHTDVAGLYAGTAIATNAKGYTSSLPFYVAVTNVSPLMNLAGTWWPTGGFILVDSGATQITKLANGLYSSSNTAAINIYTSDSLAVPDIFAVTSLSTIVFPPGDQNYASGTLSMTPGDTTISYMNAEGITVTFVKQN